MARRSNVQMQMDDILEEWTLEFGSEVEKAMIGASNATVEKLHEVSPKRTFGKQHGRYARGWSWRKINDEYVVYNATDWQLTHLLEDGHDIRNRYGLWGHVSGDGHITLAENFGAQELEIRISRGLK